MIEVCPAKYYIFLDTLFKITSGLKNSPVYVFLLKKLKNDIEIVLNPTGFKL